MTVEEIQAFCLALPGTSEDLKWGNDLCFCVAKKMYAVLGIEPDRAPRLSFKTTPPLFQALITRPGIEPAPYVARYHWVMLEHLEALDKPELMGLLHDSYQLVFSKLPKSARERIST